MLQLKGGKYLGSNKRSWEANGVFISETEYHSKVFEGWHYHENNHITFILQGGNQEQRKNREFEAVPGEILFYASGELHRNLNTKHPSRNINIEIENSFFLQYNLDIASFNDTKLNRTNAKFALLKAYRECLTNDEHSQASIHGLLLNFIVMTTHIKDEKFNPQWVRQIRDILNDRWNENVFLHELASLVQVHPVTISKFFPKYFRCTLGEYVRKVRIEKAVALIQKSQLSLTEVALQCGFFDQSHFIRAFKQMTGFLPNGYRKI
ncbi:MAG TPA: AraC family transcriptional regulator [Cyclobacteriaceae bacterium]